MPPFISAMIIPTGVGASIGGFAGDATPYLNLLASVSDILITHPNVANAAVFQKLPDNALYVEGYGLDQFMQGHWGLAPVRHNKIGVVFDAGIKADMLTLHINTLNAVRSVYGVDIIGYVQTEHPVEITCELTEAGISSGSLRNPKIILDACRHLQTQGATAIALCCLLPELDEEDEASYRTSGGVDPIGGIEGILSHLVVSELGIPCAHVPVFPWETALPVTDTILDPRTAAEFIAPTFMPCVLTGLHRAPQFVKNPGTSSQTITVEQLNALVVPADALGGLPVLAALAKGISVITVEVNHTVLDVGPSCFNALPPQQQNRIRTVRSYEEAAGALQMMRLGLTSANGVSAADISNLKSVSVSR